MCSSVSNTSRLPCFILSVVYLFVAGCGFSTFRLEDLGAHFDEVHEGEMKVLKPIVKKNRAIPRIPTKELPEFVPVSEVLQLFPVYPDPRVDLRSLRTPSPKVSVSDFPSGLLIDCS